MFKMLIRGVGVLLILFLASLGWQAYLSSWMSPTPGRSVSPGTEVTRIAFGSCNDQDDPQGFWETIAATKPDYWLWMGDNVYADGDASVLTAGYAQLQNDPDYQAFTAGVQVYGIYDDHDYGTNDGDRTWPYRDTAATLLLNLVGAPSDHPARRREGAYQTYVLGEGERTIRLILLDARYFREPLAAGKEQRYQPDPTANLLGETQWQWLEKVLATDSSAATLIVSSIQVLTRDQPYEKWADFPAARTRLERLLATYRPPHLTLLSGDRHLAEAAYQTGEYNLLEITSSGLTHSYEGADEENRYRISPLVDERNFGLLTVHWNHPGGPLFLYEILSPTDGREHFRLLRLRDSLISDPTTVTMPTSDMTRVLKPCPESPNCVSTQSTQRKKKMEPLRYTGDLAAAKAKLRDLVDGMSRTNLLEEDDNYLHFSFTTLPIPFVDDVEFLFDDAKKIIHFRSASRVGYSDLGVNARRMKKVTRRWEAASQN